MMKLKRLMIGLILSGCMVGPLWALDSPEASGHADPPEKAGGVKSLEDRIKALEDAVNRTAPSQRWYDRLQISGLIEIDAGSHKIDVKDLDEEDDETNDIELASVELNVDAKIADHVEGHVKIAYGDDDLFIDEGFITLAGGDRFPAYLIVGRQYIPFGNYETHFISDPNTLVLGETNEGAVVAGYRIGEALVNMAVGVYNARAGESDDDDTVNSLVASIQSQPFEGLNLGVSYVSNLAGADGFTEEVVESDDLESLVGGWSAFIILAFRERFDLAVEYVGAIDHFRAGEIYAADDTHQRKPAAWNVELGANLTDGLSVALRYGGSDDGGESFLPETQYGAIVNWGWCKNTNLAVEYLHGEFEDDCQDSNSVTAQLAIEF